MRGVFIHAQGLCETTQVGEGTRIWAYAHVLPGARIGRDCNICDGVFIENDVIVGNDVTIKSGVQLWDGVRLGERVFVGPNATFTNDAFPRSKQHLASFPLTVVEDDASIGANATVLPGVTIGAGAMIGAGAVIVRSVPPKAIVVGNPGRVVGYAGATELDVGPGQDPLPQAGFARFVRLNSHRDRRGRLSVVDVELPFPSRRVFLVDQVPVGEVRGAHSHRTCHQLMVAVTGRMMVAIDDGTSAWTITLSDPEIALHVPPGIWSMQFGHSEHAALLVMASHPYDRSDYISDYAEFLKWASSHRKPA